MGERRTGFRLAVGLLAGLVLALEIQALVQALDYQTALQQRALTQARTGFQNLRPQVEAALRPGGLAAWNEAASLLLRSGIAAEVDFFGAGGDRLLSVPSPSPTSHWPTADLLSALRPSGPVLLIGPLVKPVPRLLTYVSFPSGDTTVVLRLSAQATELVEDLRRRRPLLVGHGLAVGLLALLLGLAFLPPGEAAASTSSPALGAYEEAMGRLRDQDQARVREHQAEKRRMEDLVKDKEAMARAGELTAGIVHEVRNGLGTIVGYARLIEKAVPAAEGREAAAGILAECQTLETVVRRFMDFVKDETLNLAPLDLASVLRRVVARESRGRPGGLVRMDDPTGLPPVVGDEEMLERAFENLVRNALEAAGPQGHVDVSVGSEKDGTVCVRVADDGPGLPADLRTPRPFYTTKPGGLGLGLPMAVKIVGLHEGEIAFAGVSPHGLEVRVSLPLSPHRG